MKIGKADMKAILAHLKNPVGADGELPPDLKEQISHLNLLLINDPQFEEMIRTLITITLIQCVTKGTSEPGQVYDKLAQMGTLVGLSIGFQLGLREAGLEMGIPSKECEK